MVMLFFAGEVRVSVVDDGGGFDVEGFESADEVFADELRAVGIFEDAFDFHERADVFDFIDADVDAAVHGEVLALFGDFGFHFEAELMEDVGGFGVISDLCAMDDINARAGEVTLEEEVV